MLPTAVLTRALAVAMLLLISGSGAHALNILFLENSPAKHFSDEDMEMFTAAVDEALNNSADEEITAWRNPDTNASGRLKPLRTYQAEGATCRRLQIANKAGGKKSNVAFNFCRQPDGTWRVVD